MHKLGKLGVLTGAVALLAAAPAHATDSFEISHGTYATNSAGVVSTAHAVIDGAGGFRLDATMKTDGPTVTQDMALASGWADAGKRFSLAPGAYRATVDFHHLTGHAASDPGLTGASGDVTAMITCTACSNITISPLTVVRSSPVPDLNTATDEEAVAIVKFTVDEATSVLV